MRLVVDLRHTDQGTAEPSGGRLGHQAMPSTHQEATTQPGLRDQLARPRSPAAAGNMPAHA